MARSHGLFQLTGSLHPGRSTFDLSYSKKFDATFGLCYPVMCDEVVPGDTWHGGNQIVCRAVVPLKAPVMQNWKIYTHYFFVPYRILDNGWEEFITGGINGTSDISVPIVDGYVQRTDDTTVSYKDVSGTYTKKSDYAKAKTGVGGLYDFLYGVVNQDIPLEDSPLAYPEMAYNAIFNDYYRDENFMHPVTCHINSVSGRYIDSRHATWKVDAVANGQLDTYLACGPTVKFGSDGCNYFYKGLFYRSWKKDYFTSALPWQQRGTSPSLTLDLATTFDGDFFNSAWSSTGQSPYPFGLSTNYKFEVGHLSGNAPSKDSANQAFKDVMNAGLKTTAQGSASGAVLNVADLRWMFQMQRWLERNARGGIRYTEFLKSHFGIAPRDERLQRPEYLGGSVQSIVVSEVLQTSATEVDEATGKLKSTAQGNMAGHGLSVNAGHCFDYTASEYGLIMGLMSIMPESEYQQGLNRQWSRKIREHFYFPEFQCLSEQAILGKELFCSSDTTKNNEVFGYQGTYDEMRYKPNLTCGRLRNGESFDYWTMSRYFSDLPQLGASFIRCKPETVGIFATDENPFIVNFGNILKVTRPISSMSNPGLVDHF